MNPTIKPETCMNMGKRIWCQRYSCKYKKKDLLLVKYFGYMNTRVTVHQTRTCALHSILFPWVWIEVNGTQKHKATVCSITLCYRMHLHSHIWQAFFSKEITVHSSYTHHPCGLPGTTCTSTALIRKVYQDHVSSLDV